MILLALALLSASATDRTDALPPAGRLVVPLPKLEKGETYRVQVSLSGAIRDSDRAKIRLAIPPSFEFFKTLHAGDPDLTLMVRPAESGDGSLAIEADPASGPLSVRSGRGRLEVPEGDRPAIEAEPNDSWRSANPLVIGRDVYGTADDVDYLENPDEGRSGLDWFRFEVADDAPSLVYFHLELLDRDVSANLRVHRLDPASGEVRPYESGKDPMEIVHDRERERYSTHLSRTLARGTYFVEVNANHPDYILRTRRYPVPPYSEPRRAVEAGLDYLLEVGDAWFAQVPREGNRFVRSSNLHDTTTRCSACHASSFPTEASLVGLANGYPIRAKSSMLALVDRMANSPTPLYGPDGLYWQRFIAIPLQAQGKQGSILLDFESMVLGHPSKEFERFGPFLRAAWRGRGLLPMDEANGVVPLDSKFGFAWRDWRVLDEMMRRSGRVDYAQAADAIVDILNDPATNEQVETLQDRIHRLHAWALIDKERFADRIRDEAEALLRLQNPDGGWHELDKKPGPSADYTTGQMAWTLLRAGIPRDDPRMARALAYLLARQQPFGGWFQTTTHENFRTPMRETRYAVEALAEAYPLPGTPRKGWGNRDSKPARIPREGPIVATLDDLENLWDVPEADRPEFARSILKLLGHPEPLVRARAAACLGRLGDTSAAEALAARLGDPSKMASRSASWALRKLGNRGIGLDALKSALESPEAATRRGAVRAFAYQFYGMDGRLDLADRLIALTADPDLWTRLQAVRSLCQWFYRSNDPAFRRRIVDTFIDRMGRSDVPVVRKALSEGMYVLLDENLGGGVSLQKNLAILPEKFRRNALKGREDVEREVLLGPILAALESGNALQREALVRAFDGSFFRGRSFARKPTGMLDVGNDREFGFLVEPDGSVLDRTFAALLNAPSDAETRRRAILLASFFLVTERSADASIQVALLKGLADPDPGVRDAARSMAARSLYLRGAESDPARVELVRASIVGDDIGCRAVVRAIGRNPALVGRPEVLDALRGRLARGEATALLPVLGRPEFADRDVLDAIRRSWPGASDSSDRLELLNALLNRTKLWEGAKPPAEAVEMLRLAAVDPSAAVREQALASAVQSVPGTVSDHLLLVALVDEAPALRRLGLGLASPRETLWGRPDAVERLLSLLVDPDASVRDGALACVERNRLAKGNGAVARRVKALASDPALKGRAESCLRDQGHDPIAVEADFKLGRTRMLSLSSFRSRVNPLLYRAGEDGHSCARCHATHNVFRIAEAGPSGEIDGESLMVNYRSALKVVNPGDPEASLILRKPRSPAGLGNPDPSSPTGLTHVGGPRWESPDHPAYRAILAWINESSKAGPPEARASADGYAAGFAPDLAVDGDSDTFWQTEFVGANPGYPHELILDLGSMRRVEGLLYVPRQDASTGRVKDFEVRTSSDDRTWSEPIARGTWADDPTRKFVPLPATEARFVQLRGLSEVNGLPSMSAAELAVDAR